MKMSKYLLIILSQKQFVAVGFDTRMTVCAQHSPGDGRESQRNIKATKHLYPTHQTQQLKQVKPHVLSKSKHNMKLQHKLSKCCSDNLKKYVYRKKNVLHQNKKNKQVLIALCTENNRFLQIQPCLSCFGPLSFQHYCTQVILLVQCSSIRITVSLLDLVTCCYLNNKDALFFI